MMDTSQIIVYRGLGQEWYLLDGKVCVESIGHRDNGLQVYRLRPICGRARILVIEPAFFDGGPRRMVAELQSTAAIALTIDYPEGIVEVVWPDGSRDLYESLRRAKRAIREHEKGETDV